SDFLGPSIGPTTYPDTTGWRSFNIYVVPEPGTFALAFLGAVALACLRLRNRKLLCIGWSILLLAVQTSKADDVILPGYPLPPRCILTNGATCFWDASSTPPQVAGGDVCPPSPSPYTNFLALARPGLPINRRFFVPDTEGTVGGAFVMSMLNSEVQIQTRRGGSVTKVLLTNFWASTNITETFDFSQYPFDPRVVFDPYSQRWIAVSGVDFGMISSGVLIGIS